MAGQAMKTRRSTLPWILLFVVSVGSQLHAQQPTGSIAGIVRDATGAVIPGTGVSLTRQATGVAPQFGTSTWVPQSTLQHNHEFRYDGSLAYVRHAVRWGVLVNRIRTVGNYNLLGNAPEIDILFNPDNQGICGNDLLCYPVSTGFMGNGL